MASLKELIAQKEALEQQIANARKQDRAEAISRVKALMTEHGLTIGDLSAKSAKTKSGATPRAGGKVAAKYRNPKTGESWSGRGLRPNWLKAALAEGRKIEEFTV